MRDNDGLEDVGGVDLVFDVIGGHIGKRSARLVRAGGILVSVVGPSEVRPANGSAVDFVVESDRGQLSEIVQRVRGGRSRPTLPPTQSLASMTPISASKLCSTSPAAGTARTGKSRLCLFSC